MKNDIDILNSYPTLSEILYDNMHLIQPNYVLTININLKMNSYDEDNFQHLGSN